MPRFLVFAGTTEGREALELLSRCGCETVACVATEYGGEVLPELPGLAVHTGRMGCGEMEKMMACGRFDGVLDATHPYAVEATENIRAACDGAAVPYLRILRTDAGLPRCVQVTNTAEAARYLAGTAGKVLLTTGCKDLNLYTSVPDYRERLCPRVLPAAESLERCLQLGYQPQNIVCMQGPFSEEMNLATLRSLGATCLVTKNSGEAGGFWEKCEAARKAGAELVVIGRPGESGGVMMDELPRFLRERWGLAIPEKQKESPSEAYFPMFVRLAGRDVAVVGAGEIAARRINTLLEFGCRIHVIAPEASLSVQNLSESGKINLTAREYRTGDCAGCALAVAATDCREVNHRVYEECTAAGIPVSVADCRAECSFYFPGVVRSGPAVIGVTASGTDHHLASAITRKIKALLSSIVEK